MATVSSEENHSISEAFSSGETVAVIVAVFPSVIERAVLSREMVISGSDSPVTVTSANAGPETISSGYSIPYIPGTQTYHVPASGNVTEMVPS